MGQYGQISLFSYLSLKVSGEIVDNIVRPRQSIPQTPPSVKNRGDVEAKDECQGDVACEIPAINHHLLEHTANIKIPWL